MSDLISTVPSNSVVPKTRDEALALALTQIKPYQVVRIDVGERTIYSFMKIGAKKEVGMSAALSDLNVHRQIAYIVAFDGSDTFQMGYARNGEEAQTVYDIPVARLMDAVKDLRDAGFG